MSWTAYEVTLRLLSPLHVGWGKVGNIQRTRPYVTGRVLWGALAARLARDAPSVPAAADYAAAGQRVHERLAFTYFYPAVRVKGSAFSPRFRWAGDGPAAFDRRFMRSYAGTALTYPQQGAAETTLHEIEFISPRALDNGNPVYLFGYIFERDDCADDWRSALGRVQLGGERGYGWGRVAVEKLEKVTDSRLFGEINVALDGARPVVHLDQGHVALAHALSTKSMAGEVEPLVGREWRAGGDRRQGVGQHLAFNGICFLPGAITIRPTTFAIEQFGIWEAQE